MPCISKRSARVAAIFPLVFTCLAGGCKDDDDSAHEGVGGSSATGGGEQAGDTGGRVTTGGSGHAGEGGGSATTPEEGGAVGTPGGGGEAGAPLDPEAAFESLVGDIMEEEQLPGLAAAVVQGDQLAWTRGYGFADLESERPVTPDTPFTLASISKTFIAVAMMQALEDGTLTLDTPVNEVGLPFVVDNPHLSDEVITLRHLATHTSSILDGSAYDCSYYVEADDSPLYQLVDPSFSCAEPMPTELGEYLEAYLVPGGPYYDADENYGTSEPGEAGAYSNVAAALTGLALESATGTSLDELCETGIFEPLGMTNTHWHRAQFADSNPVATQYTRIEGEQIRLPDYSLVTWPDGGLRSSARDLARYVGAVMNGGVWEGTRILDQTSVETMLSSQTDLDLSQLPGTPDVQGVFWVEEFGLAGHSGGDPGSITFMYMLPGTDVAFVLLMNQDIAQESMFALVTAAAEYAASFAE